MLSKRSIELVGGGAVLLASFLGGSWLLASHSDSSNGPVAAKSAATSSVLATGQMLSLSGVDYDKADATLVVVVRDGCRFCSESVPFYREVVTLRKGRRLQLAVASLDTLEVAQEYLGRKGLTPDVVVGFQRALEPIRATPTAVLVDSQGRVKKVWLGLLSRSDQKEILGLAGANE